MIRRLIEGLRQSVTGRLEVVRAVAGEFVDDADDRWRLVAAESRREVKRWIAVAIGGIVAILFGFITLLWGAATVIMLAWETPYRLHAIYGVLAFWAVGLVIASIVVLARLKGRQNAFEMSRQVFAADLDMLRRNLRRES